MKLRTKPLKPFRYRVRGFTLLEMLLVLGFMASLMLATTQLISQGASVWSSSDFSIRAVENDKVALNFIRKMFNRAKPLNWEDAESGKVSKMFVGEPEKVFFVAPLPIVGADQLGLYLFSLSVEKTDEYVNKGLVVSYWPLNEASLEKTLENEKSTEVIMTDVESMTLSYFGDRDYRDGLKNPEWHEDWIEIHDFPLAIKMTLERSELDEENPDANVRMAWDGLVFSLLQRSIR